MRPIYETQADLDGERAIADTLSAMWSCTFHKLPISYRLDYAVQRNCIVRAFCEIKSRKYTMKQISDMGGYKISLSKWTAAKNLCSASGVPFLIVIQAKDGLWMKSFDHHSMPRLPVSMWGRKDRNDDQDIEPCTIIPCSLFQKI